MSQREHKILYVDDEPANLTAFRYAFEDRFEIVTAGSGPEALATLQREKVAVLLSDQRMPGMSGSELCATVKERHPDVVRIIVTAYSDITAAVAAINQGQVSRYLIKPWREEQMAEVLSAGVEAYQLGVLMRSMQLKLLQNEQQASTTYLLGRVLHELANPAASVHTNLQWMTGTMQSLLPALKKLAPPELGETLTELEAAARDASLASGELVARIDRFKRGDQPQATRAAGTDLKRAIEVAVAIVQVEVRKKARLDLKLLPVPPVSADPTQISQIVVNLVMNAVEATAPGAPDQNRIVVSARSDDRAAVLTVEDTGSGIEPELIERVFEPFVSTKGSDVQRGFGLAIVKELITSLGGDIKVSSQVGKGTTFTVSLPLASAR